jgi:hypothetical protein
VQAGPRVGDRHENPPVSTGSYHGQKAVTLREPRLRVQPGLESGVHHQTHGRCAPKHGRIEPEEGRNGGIKARPRGHQQPYG